MVRADKSDSSDESEPALAVDLRRGLDDADATSRHRLEDWIVGLLGCDARDASTNLWADLVGASSRSRLWRSTPGRGQSGSRGTELPGKGWSRFRVARRDGRTVVHLTDPSLTRESDLIELGGDLKALIESGHHRLVLDFSAVERLSSWVVALVAEAHRRCCARRDGALRLCGLTPDLAAIFALTGLDREVRLTVDETAALASGWPDRPAYQPLPVALLASLTRRAGASRHAMAPDPLDSGAAVAVVESGLDTDEAPENWQRETPRRLILALERDPGAWRHAAFDEDVIRIGRDVGCELRTGDLSVSRFHATIVRQRDSLTIRDLGSTNGTLVNGRRLQAPARVGPGDEIQVGSLRFLIASTTGPRFPGELDPSALVDDEILEWLAGESDEEPPPTLETFALENPSHDEPDTPGDALRVEVVSDVTLVTPLSAALCDDESVARLRDRLDAIVPIGAGQRVVVNLVHVGEISGRAVGAIVARFLTLDRLGGCMRVCQANPRVATVLEQVCLGMLIDYHATVDDAVLSAWPNADDAVAGA